jgi:alpha-glucosidase
MPVESIRDAAAGLFSIGLKTALQAVVFTLQKKRLEHEYQRSDGRKTDILIGGFVQAARSSDGGVYNFENARLEVKFLAEDLLRISWEPGRRPIPYALAKQDWLPVEAAHEDTPDGFWLSTAKASVGIEKNGSVKIFSAAGLLVREEMPPVRRGEGWLHQARLMEDEAIFGLGERNGPPNRRGKSYRMWNLDPGLRVGEAVDPIYICIPTYLSMHRTGTYLVFYENYSAGEIHVGTQTEGSPSADALFETGMLREYIILGSLGDIYTRYAQLTGFAPLPPAWSLGYQQSRWGYESEADIRQVAERAKKEDIPISAIHLDIDYMDGFRVFTVNKKRFPNLKKLAADLEGQGTRLVTIIDPGVKIDSQYDVYRSGVERKIFCTVPGGKIARGVVWPGWAAFPDFTNTTTRSWWAGWYQRLVDQGISGFWHDMNEPACLSASANVESTLPSFVWHSLEGEGGNHRQAHNLYGLLMNRAGFEALKSLRPERRPWILSRSGWAGLQRYAWSWTGDINSTWAALRQSIPNLLGLGLSGLPFHGTDIGGYFGFPEPELYIRWVQFACFTPLFRGHSAKGFEAHEPWGFGEEALRIARKFIHLRYELMPYIYTAAWQSSQTGCPMVRPLFWANPEDPALWEVEDAFLFGDSLLAAPVTEAGRVSREVRLPEGAWVDFWTGQAYTGGQTVQVDAPLERMPLLVRSGSLIPMQSGGELLLRPFGEGPWESSLYSDAGDGYKAGTVTKYTQEPSGGSMSSSSQAV